MKIKIKEKFYFFVHMMFFVILFSASISFLGLGLRDYSFLSFLVGYLCFFASSVIYVFYMTAYVFDDVSEEEKNS